MVWVVPLLRTKFIPRTLTPELTVTVFGVCLGLVSRDGPLAETVLYPQE